ncbi:hypothetical protein A3C67_02590 [Candidatus Nomurabacteria bacterium RIFCSPHIGHO2_02_FULL_42_19]|uniref:Damage-inducible protein J n=1 Tax=Candidatus Nomurabacteria bacterium RIFCSPHIGHO2_02_FULL_42_19 TaxID=1801756 RepID=A0A1F6W1T2_9BACT|nr:MAG: hypothetical protein A3C67_02590 [Candidatus Nomurabacteria bacterium RIFCSPHIGHO2_02_FULL_42_19]
MTTQVIFRIDKKIKAQAQKKAKGSGLTFSDILQMATYAYVKDDFEPVLMRKEERFNDKTAREIHSALSDIAKNKNLSRSFFSVKEATKYLSK